MLSIIIPTLNRKNLLAETVSLLLAQLHEAEVPVELLVADNASEDGTTTLFTNGGQFENIVKYVYFKNRVDIDDSFKRCIDLAQGSFINLFGDDDIPLPGFIREVSKAILQSPDNSLFYVNRIVGNEDLNNTSFVPHNNKPYGIQKMPVSKFINTYTHWPGFVTCLIFSKVAWIESSELKTYFDGYNFLSRIYTGSKNKPASFIASPLILQRRGVQSWKKHWPRYWLVSMPQLLEALEVQNITFGALQTWQSKEVSTKRFLIDSFVAKAYAYPINSSFWKESRKYQNLESRKIGSLIIQYLIPVFVAKFLYSKTNKMT